MAKSVVEGVKRGGEAAVSAGRLTRAEAACRMWAALSCAERSSRR